MNIHDRLEAESRAAARDAGLIVPPTDMTTLRVGRSGPGKLFFRSASKGCTNCYHVEKFPRHLERMRYTLSQLCQSQQKASKLVDFCLGLEKNGEYLALSVLGDDPQTIDPYEEDYEH